MKVFIFEFTDDSKLFFSSSESDLCSFSIMNFKHDLPRFHHHVAVLVLDAFLGCTGLFVAFTPDFSLVEGTSIAVAQLNAFVLATATFLRADVIAKLCSYPQNPYEKKNYYFLLVAFCAMYMKNQGLCERLMSRGPERFLIVSRGN